MVVRSCPQSRLNNSSPKLSSNTSATVPFFPQNLDFFKRSSSKRRRALLFFFKQKTAYDIRFPTSRTLAGSDAMNNDPDYSAAYVVLQTDHPTGLEGHGLTFTIGRGNEVCVAAIRALAPLVIGCTLESFTGG